VPEEVKGPNNLRRSLLRQQSSHALTIFAHVNHNLAGVNEHHSYPICGLFFSRMHRFGATAAGRMDWECLYYTAHRL
jgi:hypothetical protein